MGEVESYIDRELRRRFWHRMFTEKPYEDCECSEGGRCRPKDPRDEQVLRGITPDFAGPDTQETASGSYVEGGS